MILKHRNRIRWNRYAHQCPFGADVPAGVVPAISLALAPSVAIDLDNGTTTRFRFRHRSDRDKFAHAWRSAGYPVRTFRSSR